MERFSAQEDAAFARQHLRFEPDPWPEDQHRPDLHNVVGLTNMCCLFDRIRIATQFRSADFPRSFPAVTVRIRPPKGATLRVFGTGSVTCCGTSSQQALAYAVQSLRKTLRAQGYPVSMRPLVYENEVYSYNIGHTIDNNLVEKRTDLFSVHCPGTFPGLVFRLKNPRMQLLIFESGNIMMTGVRDSRHVDIAIKRIREFLDQCKPAAGGGGASSSGGGGMPLVVEKERKSQERNRRRELASGATAATSKPPGERKTGRLVLRAMRMIEDENRDLPDREFNQLLDETVEKLLAEQRASAEAAAQRVRKRMQDAEAASAEEARLIVQRRQQQRGGSDGAPGPRKRAKTAAVGTTPQEGDAGFVMQHMPDLLQFLSSGPQ